MHLNQDIQYRVLSHHWIFHSPLVPVSRCARPARPKARRRLLQPCVPSFLQCIRTGILTDRLPWDWWRPRRRERLGVICQARNLRGPASAVHQGKLSYSIPTAASHSALRLYLHIPSCPFLILGTWARESDRRPTSRLLNMRPGITRSHAHVSKIYLTLERDIT